MNTKIKSRRGGPRSFHRDEAIETAMRLFWRRGYQGVSIADLTAAIGIAPPSLYSAFGSKAGLYREALDRYGTMPGAVDRLAQAENLDDAIVGLLRGAVYASTASRSERGCMISSGMIECAVENQAVAQDLADRRRGIRDSIAKALERWLDRPGAKALANYFSAVMQGLSVQARDGASKAGLERVADEAIAGFRARNIDHNPKRNKKPSVKRSSAISS